MNYNWAVTLVLALAAILSVASRKLDALAGLTGFLTALLIYAGAGNAGILSLAAFFVLATIATSLGLRKKQKLGTVEKNKGKRTSGQVLANAGVAAICGVLMIVLPRFRELLQLMLVASLASATADTLSSELGNIYGRNYYNILTGKPDQQGLDGVVSLEGTVIGIAGAFFIALLHAATRGSLNYIVVVVVAGAAGNVVDSVLGASLERKHFIGNNVVNFLNTAAGAITAAILYFL